MKILSNLKINAKGKTIVEYAILVAFIAIITFTTLFIILKLINNFYLEQNPPNSLNWINNYCLT